MSLAMSARPIASENRRRAANPSGGTLAMFLTALSLAGTASAGSVTGAHITGISIEVPQGSVAFVSVDVSKSNNPGCNTNGTWSFVLPLSNSLDNQMLALLLAARASQIPVTLQGDGQCDTYGNVETLNYITY